MDALCQTLLECQKIALAEVIRALEVILCDRVVLVLLLIHVQHFRYQLVLVLFVVQFVEFVPVRPVIALRILTIVREYAYTFVVEPVEVFVFGVFGRAGYH